VNYYDVKAKLLALFEQCKLNGKENNEWGFLNEADKDILKIGYATNLTPDVVSDAAKNKVDLIITHHDAWEFVFGMKETCAELLSRHNITHAWFHLPLDDASFGTASAVADALGLANHQKGNLTDGYSCSVIGELPTPCFFEPFAEGISHILQESVRAYQNNDNPVRKVCITTGAGNSTNDIKYANENGCDTYITGEYNLYSQLYAKYVGINLLVGSHTNTEVLGVRQLVSSLTADMYIESIRLYEENY